MPCAPSSKAETPGQKASLAESFRKYAIYERSEGDKETYFQISCKPITEDAERDMEVFSDIWTWKEEYLDHWEEGVYNCARCNNALFSSTNKWKGPCVWPSFRSIIDESNADLREVVDYNGYTVKVQEVYCGKCDLFVGHGFEDGVAKGDSHPEARWRF
jgi:peptide-methionine (R)-S-oxide reductase